MSGQQLWLVRHGETEWSASGRHTSRTDLELNEAGEREALRVMRMLQSHEFGLVLSSPRRRALRTAELAGFRPIIDEDLVEWDYGPFEGMTTEEIRLQYPGWTIWDGPWPGGEEPADVAARADRVTERALSLPTGASALAFAHGHILRVVATRWLRRPPTDWAPARAWDGNGERARMEHGEPAVTHWNVPAHFADLAQG